MAKERIPNSKEIEAKKSELLKNGKKFLADKRSPKRKLLDSIKQEIETLKNEGLLNTQISSVIKQTFSITITASMIADFLEEECGIPKKPKAKSTQKKSRVGAPAQVKNEVFYSDDATVSNETNGRKNANFDDI